MSVRHSLMAILADGPAYGAALKSAFEARTGGTWPVNVGQVYTTLDRLERDGLVTADPPDADGRIGYQLTASGAAELATWWRTPVDREQTPREELVIKLALAITSPGVDSAVVAQTQRSATMHRLQQLTRLKTSIDPTADLAWLMVVEHQLFAAEAEIRWLDQLEASLRRYGHRTPTPSVAAEAADAAQVLRLPPPRPRSPSARSAPSRYCSCSTSPASTAAARPRSMPCAESA